MIPQPYFEDDLPNPLSEYGKSKRDSEIAVRDNSPNYMLVRTSWLYGINGNNFIKWLVKETIKKKNRVIRLIGDQFGSPTWTYRLAMQIRELLQKDGRGTYHATSEGYCSFIDYGRYVLERLGLKATIEECKMKDLKRPAKRPSNCILENRRLKKQGINLMVDWKSDVDTFLDMWGERIIREAEDKK
jgi:dTDP-4-dehydrorhamnose reductase